MAKYFGPHDTSGNNSNDGARAIDLFNELSRDGSQPFFARLVSLIVHARAVRISSAVAPSAKN